MIVQPKTQTRPVGMIPASTQQIKKPASPMAVQQRGFPQKAPQKPLINPTIPAARPSPQFGTPVPGSMPPQMTPQERVAKVKSVMGMAPMNPAVAERVANVQSVMGMAPQPQAPPQIMPQPARDPLVQARIDATQNAMFNGGAPINMGMGGFNNQATVTMDPMLKLRILMQQRQQQQGQRPQLQIQNTPMQGRIYN